MKKGQEKTLINHFREKVTFSRADLRDYFNSMEGQITESTLAWRIYELKNKSMIQEISRGQYTLSIKPKYQPAVEKTLEKISKVFTNNYHDANYCLWDINWLNEFSLQQFSRDYVIFETEKDLIESVAHSLADNRYLSIIHGLTAQLISYSGPEPLIIVEPFITRSPVSTIRYTEHKTISIPTLEKMLVDVFVNKSIFHFLEGAETDNIFRNALDRYSLNFTTLLSYAGRRGKKKELAAYLLDNFPELKTNISR